jgi:hypothetical protein
MSTISHVPSSDTYNRLLTTVSALIETYGRAWTSQDPNLILSVFTPDATYHERVLRAPMRGHSEIKDYWESKVCREQGNIQFRLNSLYVDPVRATAIAEWEAWFDDIPSGCRKHMSEVAILAIEDDKISSLKEWWSSEKVSAS